MAIHFERQRADDPEAAALLARYLDELRERLGDFDPKRSVSAAPDEMAPPNGAFVVAREDGVALACGGVKRLEPGIAEIKRMYVAPAGRGRGVGKALLRELESCARELSCTRIRLDTAAPLTEAQHLYAAAGYHDIPPYNTNPYAARWFEKDL